MSLRHLMHGVARVMAQAGGAVMLLLITLTCLSVIGRLCNTLGHTSPIERHAPLLADWLTRLGPINGDFEIVEMGVAFAIFAFFPWCQLRRAHARVDIISARLPGSISRLLDLTWDILFALVLAVISWRLFIGTLDKRRYQETTFLLEWPVWWGFAACAVASLVATILAFYMVYVRVSEARGLNPGLPRTPTVE